MENSCPSGLNVDAITIITAYIHLWFPLNLQRHTLVLCGVTVSLLSGLKPASSSWCLKQGTISAFQYPLLPSQACCDANWAINRILIAISILASNDHTTNIIKFFFFNVLQKGQNSWIYLYIIFDWNIFFLSIFCIFLRWNFKFLSYKVFFGRNMLNKYIMFSNSKISDFNIDQNNRDYDFFHNRAALMLTSTR